MKEALPLMWRNIPERYNLLGSRCDTCGKNYFPQRKVCPNCRRKGKLVEAKMPETGKIVSYSEVFVAPTWFDHETPYFLAIVELDNHATLLTQVVDSKREKIKEGARVELLFRRIYEDSPEGAIAYGYKFKVVS
ncbi:Zn-ribbon domain-containing OB-fold protein [Candidatus Micrarchaeota archaeon]|nr:Zn-ribbon domain-containing OB-fold protein [Candidatus Micrarchaeota archaeon]